LWIAAAALFGALAPAPPAKAPPEPLAANIALAREQLKLIDQIRADLDRLFRNGEAGLTDPRFKLWERRRVEALRATGAPKDVVVAELEQYIDLMKRQEAASKTEYERAVISRDVFLAAQYERLEAEMLLNQERAR
jgi:hypothetical protein